MGFPGGVAWAIMVAHVCQRHPDATVRELVNQFFGVYSHWKWPKPVKLREIVEESGSLIQWDPHVSITAIVFYV